jgi:hypothetical protein
MRIGLLLLLLSQGALAQFAYEFNQSIPVTHDTQSLSLAWSGGLNASQFNTMDLNGDGNDDLVIYDRMTERVITFLQVNNHYQYAPQYQPFFPSGIESWLLLRDYNGDGRKDIFTGDNLGMKVYENTTADGSALTWSHILFFTGFPGAKSEVLLTKGISVKVNLQLNHDDLPSISDVDGDGDLDIFNAGYSSNSRIEFHRNMSIEKYGTLDSLDFERVTQHWGGVENCHCGEFAFNEEDCDHSGGKINHAGGKSLLALDIDNDGDQDMIFSESECTELYLLRNDGTNENPLIGASIPFPTNTPANLVVYPAAYYEDLNFDNKKDLLVSPNIFSREFLITNLQQSTWFYENTGTTSQPSFSVPQINFLQENMIEAGENSAPVFYDIDGDGDLDLLIGTYSNSLRGSIFLYENIGTLSQPSFKLITQDYQGLSYLNQINIRPIFADMNGDTKWDLAFTATDRFGGGTQLFYLLNERYIGVEFNGAPIASGFYVFPFEPVTLTDVDLDQKMDLLVGRQNGSLEYWRNTGSKKLPSWTLIDESFLGLSNDFDRQYPACASMDLDGDDKADLVIGDQRGVVSVVSNYREAGESATLQSDIIYNPISDQYVSLQLGGRAWPAVGNIFKANKPAIVIGNNLGGLHILKPSESIAETNSPIIHVYPNPVELDQSPIVTVKTDLPTILYTLSIVGQEVLPPRFLQASQSYEVSLAPLNKGVYLLRFIINGKSYTRKIVIR